MNRREFFNRFGKAALLTAAAASGVVDPESFLWTPNTKTVFLPASASAMRDALHAQRMYNHLASAEAESIAFGFRKHVFVTPDLVTREALELLKKNLVVGNRLLKMTTTLGVDSSANSRSILIRTSSAATRIKAASSVLEG